MSNLELSFSNYQQQLKSKLKLYNHQDCHNTIQNIQLILLVSKTGQMKLKLKGDRLNTMFRNLMDALTLLKQQDYKNSHQILIKLLRQYPNFANVYYMLSICLSKMGKIQLSQNYKKQAQRLNENYYTLFDNSQDLILKDILQIIKRQNVENADYVAITNLTWFQIITAYIKNQDLNTCLIIIQAYYALQPKRQEQNRINLNCIYSQIGLLYYQMTLYSKSINKYKQAINICNSKHLYYNNLAILYILRKDFETSEQLLAKSRSLKNESENLNYKFIFSYCLEERGKIGQAYSCIKEIVAKQQHTVIYKLRLLAILLKNYKEKDEQIVRLIQLIIKTMSSYPKQNSFYFNQYSSKFVIQTLQFVKDNKQHVSKYINQSIWSEYVHLMDMILILGLIDKYKAYKTMQKLRCKMSDQLAGNLGPLSKLDQSNQQILKDQQQLEV